MSVTRSRDAGRGQVRGVRGLTVGGIVALLLSACGALGSSEPASDIGQLRTTDAGIAITVPALWAAARSDGTYDGGIEPTEVIVSSTAERAGYTVDLSSIEAKGAGPSWEAATASAAAFATLFSGTEPSRVALSFTITGPIDGPSAGGLLTCGLLAAFAGTPFKPGITMTGTISPDGSIGTVGYIPRKVQAAAQAGFRTVIIPAESVREPIVLPDGRTLEALASSLGVTLVPVRTVGEAYAILTGRPSFYPAAPPAPLAATTMGVAEDVARDATARLRAQIDASPPEVDAYARDLAARALTAAEGDLAAGRPVDAYGQLAFGANRLARANGAARIQDVLDGQGLTAARAVIAADARDVSQMARAAVARLQARPPSSVEIQASMPNLLSWPVYAFASVEAVIDQVDATSDPGTLLEMGRITAEERLALEETLPDAERIMASAPGSPPSPTGLATLTAYSDLFDQAARANERYARDVLKRGGPTEQPFADQGLTASIGALAELSRQAPTGPAVTFTDAALRTAVTMTDFWFTAALVTGAQAYGTGDAVAVDVRRAFAPEAQDAAVIGAAGTVDSVVALVGEQGVRPELPVWSTQWSRSLSDAYRGTPEGTEANWLAQSELWYNVMEVVMLRAMTAP